MEVSELKNVLWKVGQLLKEHIDYYDERAMQSMDSVHRKELLIMSEEMKRVTEEIWEMCDNFEI